MSVLDPLKTAYKSTLFSFNENLYMDSDQLLKVDMSILQTKTSGYLQELMKMFTNLQGGFQTIKQEVISLSNVTDIDRKRIHNNRLFELEYGVPISNIDSWSLEERVSVDPKFSSTVTIDEEYDANFPYCIDPNLCDYRILTRTQVDIKLRLSYLIKSRATGEGISLNILPPNVTDLTFPLPSEIQVDYPNTTETCTITKRPDFAISNEYLYESTHLNPILVPDEVYQFIHIGPEHWRYDVYYAGENGGNSFYLGAYQIDRIPKLGPSFWYTQGPIEYDFTDLGSGLFYLDRQTNPFSEITGLFTGYYRLIKLHPLNLVDLRWNIWHLDDNQANPVHLGLFDIVKPLGIFTNKLSIEARVNESKVHWVDGDCDITIYSPIKWTPVANKTMYNMPSNEHCGLIKLGNTFLPCDNIHSTILQTKRDKGLATIAKLFLPFKQFNTYYIPTGILDPSYVPRSGHVQDSDNVVRLFANDSRFISIRNIDYINVVLPNKRGQSNSELYPYIIGDSPSLPYPVSVPSTEWSKLDFLIYHFLVRPEWFRNNNTINVRYFIVKRHNYAGADSMRIYGVRPTTIPPLTSALQTYYQRYDNSNMLDSASTPITTLNPHPAIQTPNLREVYYYTFIPEQWFTRRQFKMNVDDILVLDLQTHVLENVAPVQRHFRYTSQFNNINLDELS